ncbi:MAG: NYN domain-containing protein, partial [Actinomycetota bacterium]
MAEPALAVLVDFENVARPGAKSRNDFDIQLVLNRLAEKGRVLVKRAYADWSRYRDARHDLQNAGLELIELPSAREGAKNRADIKLAVDAMELAYSREHLDYFVIVSGDSDFTPLVGKVRELNKRVIGIAHRESSSELLIANCDEFIFYENLVSKAGTQGAGRSGRAASKDLDPVDLVRETLEALQREGVEWPLASVVKDSMRRKFPAFDESDHGHSTFSKFLEAMRDHGILRLETDPRSGTYRVELTESRAAAPRPAAAAAASEERAPAAENGEGRRRRRRRRGGSGETVETPVAVDGGDEGMEVFEVRVTPTPDLGVGTLPDLDQPISYEDMLMLAPDVAAELPPVPETAEEPSDAPPPREARRRRRRVRDEEVTLEAVGSPAEEETPAEDAVAEEEAPAEEVVAEEAPAEEAVPAEEPQA